MIELYTAKTPNGHKASIMLEEIGAPYEVKSVNLLGNEQFTPEFEAISPNHKIPAIVDKAPSGSDAPIAIFESGAILTYLADKHGVLAGDTPAEKAAVQSWSYFQAGYIGPNLGTLNHFLNIAEEKSMQAIERFQGETARGLKVLEKQLAQHDHIAGSTYSLADIMLYPWIAAAWSAFGKVNPDLVSSHPYVDQWVSRIGERPAVQKGMAIPS